MESVKFVCFQKTANFESFRQNDVFGVSFVFELEESSKNGPFARGFSCKIAQFLSKTKVEDEVVVWNFTAENDVLSKSVLVLLISFFIRSHIACSCKVSFVGDVTNHL